MTRRVLWKLSVLALPQIEQPIAQLLEARFGQPAAIFTDLEKGQTTVAVYLAARPEWSATSRRSLANELQNLGAPAYGRPKAVLQRLRPQDWTESWKRHFKPLNIRGRLWVRPSWRRSRAKPWQVEVVLDPGMSFGTGHHPTTSFCLGELARHYQPGRALSLLDIG